MMDITDLYNFFTYHKPEGDQPQRYEILRAAGLKLAQIFLELCPDSVEKQIAIEKVREAVMWGNAAIACHDRPALRAMTETPNREPIGNLGNAGDQY